MSRPEGGLHGLKAYPSARSADQDFRHGIMLLVGLAWLIVMCNAGSRTARRAGGLHMKGWRKCAQVPTMRREGAVAASVASEAAASVVLAAAWGNPFNSFVGCGATNRAMRRRHKLAEAAIAQLGAMMPDAFAGDAHALRFASRCSVQREIQKFIDCARNCASIVTCL